ncbi:hypothetical protein QBZ16_003547 [Prototheca wickerhamii]|uniref:Fucolectin tachylectin-4 pentraxin-1 domain-containing protein n=1 Tax=Prototheca wickerhamii TaxID=3111 RepID=A0AAD9MIN5_PROWI|nr:hypothetical protein QBZ16_003547 [Prototheca wickerhamii]
MTTDRVLVQFKSNVVRAYSDDDLGVEFQKTAVGSIGVYTITDNMTVEEKVEQLSALRSVANVEPDFKVAVTRKPNDPKYPLQWHLPKVSAPAAWDLETGTRAVKVCAIDSGSRIDHPDLVANVAGGWNLVPVVQTDGSAAPAMYSCRFIWDDHSGYVSDAMTCLSLCRGVGAMITSNSWGGVAYSDFMYQQIKAARAAGQLFINAAGNSVINMNASPKYPAAYDLDNIIAVAATSDSDGISAYSNYGNAVVHIGAPGDGIMSTFYDLTYGWMWGTSMAAPVVTGAAVLAQSLASRRGVTLTYAQIRDYILNNADTVPGLTAYVMGGRRLNISGAIAAIDKAYPATSPSVHPARSNPWWVMDLGAAANLTSVVIKGRVDCGTGCYTDLGRAQVYLGNSLWQGPSSRAYYTFCGQLPVVMRAGSRHTVDCEAPVGARYVSVYLPKNATSLTLCEVDVVVG